MSLERSRRQKYFSSQKKTNLGDYGVNKYVALDKQIEAAQWKDKKKGKQSLKLIETCGYYQHEL